MQTFWELLKESVITQATITVAVIAVTLYLLAMDHPIPPDLWALDTLVIGFYFGSKVGVVQGQNKAQADMLDKVLPTNGGNNNG